MALTDRLRSLDQKLLPGTREDDEDAESYLRRVAAGRAISPAQAGDVMAALRQYFRVEEGQAADADDDGDDEQSTEKGTEQPTDEASDEASDDESGEDDSGDDDSGDDSEDDSSDDESGSEEKQDDES